MEEIMECKDEQASQNSSINFGIIKGENGSSIARDEKKVEKQTGRFGLIVKESFEMN
jgi:hypothetical protein